MREMQNTTIKNGDRFNYRGTVYEVRGMADATIDMIPAVEIARPSASPLWKPSPSGYQYFTSAEIIGGRSS